MPCFMQACRFDSIPKAELHVHLEGAMPREALVRLVHKYVPKSPFSLEDLERKFTFRTFAAFRKAWLWKTRFLRSYADFTFIAEAFAKSVAQQNIKYVEAFVCPADFAAVDLCPLTLLESIRKGLAQVPAVEVNLIVDLARDRGARQADRMVKMIVGLQDLGIVGVGLGGPEKAGTLRAFKPAFAQAREHGLLTTVQGGENSNARSIWEAILELQPDRLGHATVIAKDIRLIDELQRRNISIEACPLSNLRCGLLTGIGEHPIRLLLRNGIPTSLNTDNPVMIGNTLSEEISALVSKLQFSREEIFAVLAAGFNCSSLTTERKAAMVQAVRVAIERLSLATTSDASETKPALIEKRSISRRPRSQPHGQIDEGADSVQICPRARCPTETLF